MTDWFLNPINPAAEDAWCFQVIPTGAINVYDSYRLYYKRLALLISQTDGGSDQVFLVGWHFNLDTPLMDNKSALTWLRSARGRHDTRVRLLASGNMGNEPQAAIAMQGTEEKGEGKIDAIIDDQLDLDRPHHQKAGFIRTKSNSHLFVGGMDITGARLDVMHDVQAEVMGSAADLGRITLEERWESATGMKKGSRSTVIPRREKPLHHVQFIRTYPPVGKQPPASTRNFAEIGEHTYYELLKKAIGRARTSIYLEEQYLFPMGSVPVKTARNPTDPARRSDVSEFPLLLEDALEQAINRHVRLIIIGPNFDGEDILSKRFKPLRAEVVDKLKKAKGSAKVPPVLLKQQPGKPFLHSKTWIFDDEFVVIGSANHWEQSHVSVRVAAESEFGIAFTSEGNGKALGFEKARFGRALRLKLWERLRQDFNAAYRFPYTEVVDLDAEIAELKSKVGDKEPFADMP
ncbi:MAG TPA: hypothetical protein VFU13_08565 [Steroidobacteraceae bacterium]|nr:hypothetical protein [Steroidobacteraceae bacterium]